jgi:peptide methionine sulfoxide reductase msrA/msrB
VASGAVKSQIRRGPHSLQSSVKVYEKLPGASLIPQAPGDAMQNETFFHETATFAGGCFWCVQSDFDQYNGIVEAVSGYTGGHKPNPTYEDVSSGLSGHLEAVQVRFDPAIISYAKLLEIFWRHVDPTDNGGQFVDRGAQYRTAIFFHDDRQKKAAESSKLTLAKSGRFGKPIATQILPVKKFFPAETYHQHYYKKNPIRYKFYRANSGRDQFLKKVWEMHTINEDLEANQLSQ